MSLRSRPWIQAVAEPYILFYRHRMLLWEAVAQSLQQRYAGSVLGWTWLVLGPGLLLGLYTILYTVVFQIRPVGLPSVATYILYIGAGLIPFIAVSQALGAGTVALTANKALLLNRMFPAELIPAREVLAAGSFLVVGIGLIITLSVIFGKVSLAWLLLPLIALLTAMATIGVVWALAIANLIVNDIQQMLTYIIIMLLISSPIAYTPEMLPQTLAFLIYFNPLAYYVISFQSIVVLGELPSIGILFGAVAFALFAFHSAFRLFTLGKQVIADQI